MTEAREDRKRRQPNSERRSIPSRLDQLFGIFNTNLIRAILPAVMVALLSACSKSNDTPAPAAPSAPASGAEASEIVKRYEATEASRDSSLRMRARITDTSSASNTPAQVELTILRKRTADGGETMLVEFNTAAERDRSALVTVTPQGEVEGVRYAQSNDSFIATKGVTTEESLFGMTMQELIGGQPGKYDFKLTGEVPYLSSQVYKLEGKLKERIESKFQRIVLLISKESFAAMSAEFYDSHDELARRLTVDVAEPRSGHWTRLKWTLQNLARKKTIEFETIDAKYDQNLSDAIFTRQHLKEIATKK